MEFIAGNLYHVFNRGNNSQRIFFTPANYLFFLNKMKENILPHADILAWCLMPNHFHLMIHVNEVEVKLPEPELATSDRLLSNLSTSGRLHSNTPPPPKTRNLNSSIGHILSSYTRAIQKQENRTGSLFQHRSKAICLTTCEGISPAWFHTAFGTLINVSDPEKEYPQVCFNYIHGNPLKDGLVKAIEDWEYSSARDYAGLRKGKLINKERTNEFGLKYF